MGRKGVRMKKELSVLMLAVRSSFYKILTVLIFMVVFQLSFFYLGVQKYRLQGVFSMEEMVEVSYIEPIFFIAFLLICAILVWSKNQKGSQSEYTLKRLLIHRERVFFLWSGYHICCFLVLFSWQIFAIIGMGKWYLNWIEESYISSQSLFLAFWRNDFLHSLLPLAEVSRWIRNGLLVTALGLAMAFIGNEGYRNQGLALVCCVLLVILGFSDPAGYWKADLVKSAMFLILIFMILVGERIKYRNPME